jgi:Protein of unknown function (DUF2905)
VNPLREAGRMLLILGAAVVMLGAVLYFSGKLPFRLGRLPGDITWQGKHTTIYFPIITCILLSVVLTLVFWLISFLRR